MLQLASMIRYNMRMKRRNINSLRKAIERIKGKTKEECWNKRGEGLYADWMAVYRYRREWGIKYKTRVKKADLPLELSLDSHATITFAVKKARNLKDGTEMACELISQLFDVILEKLEE